MAREYGLPRVCSQASVLIRYFTSTNSHINSASEAFSWKWGFRGDTERFAAEISDRFSLLKDGTLDRTECARLLLVNVC